MHDAVINVLSLSFIYEIPLFSAEIKVTRDFIFKLTTCALTSIDSCIRIVLLQCDCGAGKESTTWERYAEISIPIKITIAIT